MSTTHITEQYLGGLLSKREFIEKLERLYRLHRVLAGIHHAMSNPNPSEQTANRRASYATSIKLRGGTVKPEYE